MAINAHFFVPFPSADTDANIVGFGVSNGTVVSPFEPQPVGVGFPDQSYAIVEYAPAINISPDNVASIVHRDPMNSSAVIEDVELGVAFSGSAQIITDGEVTIPQYGVDLVEGEGYGPSNHWYEEERPRTAVGISEDGRQMWWVVADGTESTGYTVESVANILLSLGAYNAINMDGGGSSTLAIKEEGNAAVLLNTLAAAPRSVGSNLAVLANQLFATSECEECEPRRFRSAQLGNYILMTNDFDPVLAWKFGDPPSGTSLWSAQQVEDLLIIGITKARCITEFNGFIIIGDVEIEGQQKPSRIYWSDYNAPLSWIPSDRSLANFHEFGLGEKVLRVEPLGRYIMVYTDKQVYQGVYVGDSIPDLVFQFNAIPTDNPLRYEHTLVNTGTMHVYLSDSGVYEVTASYPRPSRTEWIHRASAAIFDGIGSDILGGFAGLSPFDSINKEQCHNAVGGFNSLTEEIWFSWPTGDNVCPDMSLVLNTRYQAADLVDHGFTAFTNYKPDYRPTVRDWLNSEGVCEVTDEDFVKEGLPLDFEPGDEPSYLFNPSEDPTTEIHPDSWCARLGDTTVEDLCENCDPSPVFLMADAEDYSIKEENLDTYYREQYDSEEEEWDQDGYYTMLQSDMMSLGVPTEKTIKMVVVDYQAEEQEPPSDLVCDIAYASQPRCSRWEEIGERELRCLTEYTEAQHTTNNTRPDLAAKYNCYRRGRFIGYRTYIGGVGGAMCFSAVILEVANSQGRVHLG
jgi:hypothetical protein